jgi:uncharacterized protein
MIRVILDTNVLISALQPESLPAAVMMLDLSGRFQLCVSDPVFAEYGEVIRCPHFKRSPKVIGGTLQAIQNLGHWVKPTVPVEQCSDPDDNMFLECAQAANADYVVTGNKRHLPDRWKKTAVIGLRKLIELLVKQD